MEVVSGVEDEVVVYEFFVFGGFEVFFGYVEEGFRDDVVSG